jgi:Phosphatidylinositol transfer protein
MIDQWHGLTMEDIRRMEAKSAEELKIEGAHGHDHGHGHGHEHHHEDRASDAAKAAGAPA